MEMEFRVLLPATATASLFPASEPYSDVHFLHTWLDKMKSSPQARLTVWEKRNAEEQMCSGGNGS